MKKLHILLLTSLLIFTVSCSKDDNDINSGEAGMHKVTFEQSGAYQDYNIAVVGGAFIGDLSVNSNGDEEQYVSSFLTDANYSIWSKSKSVFMGFNVGGDSKKGATENMQTKITIYFNNEVVHTETLEFEPGDIVRMYRYLYDVRMNPRLTTPAK